MPKIYIHNSYKQQLINEPDASVKERGKGWTYINVYNLREVKDVYLLINSYPGKSNQELQRLISNQIVPEGKAWQPLGTKKEGRRALEVINALRNFNLIDNRNNVVTQCFRTSTLNENLSNQDQEDLKSIFFSYFRFQELCAWFRTPASQIGTSNDVNEAGMQSLSRPLFYCALDSRYINTIFYELADNTDLYQIDSSSKHIMRFWDVFLKWGRDLKLIEQFSMDYSTYKIQDPSNVNRYKSFSCVYFLSPFYEVDLISFAVDHFDHKHIYLPELVLRACLTFRLPIETIKRMIIEQALKHERFIGLDRTSEIFVKRRNLNEVKKEVFFFPFFQGSFISHINLK